MAHSHLLSNRMQMIEKSMMYKFTQKATVSPNAIKKSTSLPNEGLFPFKEMTLTMTDGREIVLDGQAMATCMQHGEAKGLDSLIEQLKDLTNHLHKPPNWKDRDIIVLPGSQIGIQLICEMLINPDDFVLFSEPGYPGVFNALQCLPHRLVAVKCDSDGVLPEDLETVLGKCEMASTGKPKVLYVNPTCNNPTGTVWSEARKRHVYQIACHYDVIILEDDPYYLLQFSKDRTPSFLHLDIENRVIRLDSFSKTVSAGIRLGYAIGSKDFIDQLGVLVESSINHTPLVTQVCISEMLKTVGIEDFLKYTKRTAEHYKGKRDITIKAAECHLKDLCEWEPSAGGMYLWLKVRRVADTKKLMLGRSLQKGFLATPGAGFYIDQTRSSQFLRLSYSEISSQDIGEGFKMLSEAIKEEIIEGRNVVRD